MPDFPFDGHIYDLSECDFMSIYHSLKKSIRFVFPNLEIMVSKRIILGTRYTNLCSELNDALISQWIYIVTKSESSSSSSAESDSSSYSTTSLEYESSSFESGGSFSHDEVHPFMYEPILGSTNTNKDCY